MIDTLFYFGFYLASISFMKGIEEMENEKKINRTASNREVDHLCWETESDCNCMLKKPSMYLFNAKLVESERKEVMLEPFLFSKN